MPARKTLHRIIRRDGQEIKEKKGLRETAGQQKEGTASPRWMETLVMFHPHLGKKRHGCVIDRSGVFQRHVT